MSTGSEDDVNLMARSPPTGTVPGDVLVCNNSVCSDFGGWEIQANLTEVASENVTLPYDWAESTALSSEKIVVALSIVGLTSTTHTFKYDGASWVFLGRQSLPGIRSVSMALGGDLLVILNYPKGTKYLYSRMQGFYSRNYYYDLGRYSP